MIRCYLLHGIKTIDPGRSSISFFMHIMPKFKVVLLKYLYIPIIFSIIVPLINRRVIARMAGEVWPGQIILGHSNGAAVAYGITKVVPTRGLVLINPALDSDIEFDEHLEFIHVYWSHRDNIVWLSALMPFSLWGRMGKTGYIGKDPRVKQWEMPERHTSIGTAEVAVRWGPVIVRNIEDALKSPPG
jgi:hypothetical protein